MSEISSFHPGHVNNLGSDRMIRAAEHNLKSSGEQLSLTSWEEFKDFFINVLNNLPGVNIETNRVFMNRFVEAMSIGGDTPDGLLQRTSMLVSMLQKKDVEIIWNIDKYSDKYYIDITSNLGDKRVQWPRLEFNDSTSNNREFEAIAQEYLIPFEQYPSPFLYGTFQLNVEKLTSTDPETKNNYNQIIASIPKDNSADQTRVQQENNESMQQLVQEQFAAEQQISEDEQLEILEAEQQISEDEQLRLLLEALNERVEESKQQLNSILCNTRSDMILEYNFNEALEEAYKLPENTPGRAEFISYVGSLDKVLPTLSALEDNIQDLLKNLPGNAENKVAAAQQDIDEILAIISPDNTILPPRIALNQKDLNTIQLNLVNINNINTSMAKLGSEADNVIHGTGNYGQIMEKEFESIRPVIQSIPYVTERKKLESELNEMQQRIVLHKGYYIATQSLEKINKESPFSDIMQAYRNAMTSFLTTKKNVDELDHQSVKYENLNNITNEKLGGFIAVFREILAGASPAEVNKNKKDELKFIYESLKECVKDKPDLHVQLKALRGINGFYGTSTAPDFFNKLKIQQGSH